MPKRILISVGGTGGHLFPAQALAKELNNNDVDFLFVGSKLSTNPYFDQTQFKFQDIQASSFSLRDGVKLFQKGWAILKGTLQSIRILRSYHPDLILAFGSFHTLPLLLATRILRKKYMLHEQNIQLGRVNRLFAKGSLALISPYLKTVPYFPKKNRIAKMPLKNASSSLLTKEEARSKLGLDPKTKTILVYGGSQGAHFINTLFLDTLKYLTGVSFQVIHLIGQTFDLAKTLKRYQAHHVAVYLKKFEEKMVPLFAAADFCMSRSGASTIAEQIEFEKPAILIPYPHANNHQQHNANYMQDEVRGGIKLLEKEINASLLSKICLNFFDDTVYSQYVRNIRNYKESHHHKSCAQLIQEEVLHGRK